MGPTHQAVVPDHPTFPPYTKGKPQDNLLWSPRHTTEERGRGEEGGRGGVGRRGRCGEKREGWERREGLVHMHIWGASLIQ